MGVQRFLSSARLPISRLALPQPPTHVLPPRVLRSVASLRAYSSGIVSSPYNDVHIPEISVTQYLFDAQEPYADKTALVDGISGHSLTHGEFREQCHRLGSALTRLGVTKGDVVGLVSPNCPEFAVTFYGVAAIGAVNTTVSSAYLADGIATQLFNSGASVVVAHKGVLPAVREACEACPDVRHIIVIHAAPEDEQAGLLSYQTLLKDDGKAFPQTVQIDPREDMVVLPYSSGTTGLPKGVMLTHYNLVANMQQLQHEDISTLNNTGDKQEVFLGILPYFHIYGMVPCMGMSLVSGSKTVTLPFLKPELFVKTMEKYKITYLHTVPPILDFLASSDMVKPELLAPTHSVLCGAAPIGTTLITDLLKKFGDGIYFQEGYGMTEASPVTHVTPRTKFVMGSTGVSIPNTLTKIVDLNTGKTLQPDGGEGELCVKGPQVMKGYYKNEEATRATIDPEGWLHTGDIARMDQDNNVFIVDRLKELIKVKGLQVAPAELEDLIRQLPDVTDVGVVGMPVDRASGEAPRAFVVLSSGSQLSLKAIEDFVEGKVPPHKKLAGGLEYVEAIPRSPTGKILRRELKAMALSRLAQ
ncbi:putative 4-coumarate--CoA ligase 1 [Chionoecetes opilio]|uniref:Luciferin 4-monooxygenase n=1 Tax=Chionoecetes opilio TaxID=41210 RepID=A0A8J4YA34_CHIOP|nr:putative 4-coumarate--CoA ligase 1 [Chionoecetes opilio]